jgi:hypothetical protein
VGSIDSQSDRHRQELLEKLVSTETKQLLLTLFHNNPGLIDKIDGVALRIGRTRSDIEGDIADLVELGVLVRKKYGEFDVLLFNQAKDYEIQNAISDHLLRRSV